MRKIFLGILLCMLSAGMTAGRQRVVYTINETWEFSKEATSAEDDCGWTLVDLPHTWNASDADDDEPGMYREGMHGVRHENLLLCRRLCENESGSWLCFETLTLCQIDTSAVIRDLMTADEIEWLNRYNREVFEKLSPRLDADTAAWLNSRTRPL